ncbi:hypothetical protein ACI79G_07030 [Geodermatophilus sp. SYSU D00779]
MTTSESDGASTPADVLRETAPLDDAGAETADRYEWQAMMATVDVLAAYLQRLNESDSLPDEATFTIICELHEDWALIEGTATEIVSAKHRETSVARLNTLRALLDCGVLHLFERWEALDKTPMCRLVTTAGVADEAARLADACATLRQTPAAASDGLGVIVTRFTEMIASSRPNGLVPTEDAVASFLKSLRIQHSQPRRDHLPDMAPTRYAKPIAARLGRSDAAEAIWCAVLGLVRERMRAAGPTRTGALPTVLGVPPHKDPLAARSLTLADVDITVRVALRHTKGFARLPRRVRISRMAVKMAHGGCPDNTIERIDSLRLQHQRYWRELTATPSTRDRCRQLTNVLLKIVAESTEAVRTEESSWGVPLLIEVETRLESVAERPQVQGLDVHLLVGGVGELSNNCRVWFTDRFDVETELDRLSNEAAS